MIRRLPLIAGIAACLAYVALAAPARAQFGPATAAGLSSEEAAAARGVMMDALRRGGNQGGCTPLPRGWSTLSATVRFPDSYGGYGEWVNVAELVPVGDDLQAFLKSHGGGPFYRTAGGTSSTVRTVLCAPAGFTYWLVVDSGSAKVAIGRVTLATAGRTYRLALTAPPLGSRLDTSSNLPSDTSSLSRADAERRIAAWTVAIPRLGMSAVAVTPQFLDLVHAAPSMRAVRGLFITTVANGGWAAQSGLHQYDVVVAVNDQRFNSIRQFEDLVGALTGALQFSVIRDKRAIVVEAGGSGWQPPSVGPGFVAPATPLPEHGRDGGTR